MITNTVRKKKTITIEKVYPSIYIYLCFNIAEITQTNKRYEINRNRGTEIAVINQRMLLHHSIHSFIHFVHSFWALFANC